MDKEKLARLRELLEGATTWQIRMVDGAWVGEARLENPQEREEVKALVREMGLKVLTSGEPT